MKKSLFALACAITILVCSVFLCAAQSPEYARHFTSERLRIDLTFAGDASECSAFLSGLRKEASWSGSPNSLIDSSGYGQYWFEAFEGDELIFSKGFCTLFEEWRTTPEAQKVRMASNQTIWMPFPKAKIHVRLYQRVRATGKFSPMLDFDIDPTDRHIIPGAENNYNVVPLLKNGESAHKVDLTFVAEGYTASEALKLRDDAMRLMNYLFSMEPYAHRKKDFNVWLVESFSMDSGVDIPQSGQWKETVCDSAFDTFYEDRYLTVQDHRLIASAVSGAPFDTIFIIANESKYGGGGIYNSYALGTSDNKFSDQVFIHEFGHSFAGLGDEYYDSSVSYEDYYPRDVEPWEPNITTLVDFQSKWADMIKPGTPERLSNDKSNAGIVSIFEGAGYMSKGCYRPYYECRMLNNTAPGFCPVCQRAISRMIDHYTR